EIINLIEKEHKKETSEFMEEVDVSIDSEDEDAMQMNMDRLKKERDDLGGVNLKAEEEAEEIKERINEIKVERDDLVEAIKKLRTGINDLNKEGRERMQRAFLEVNEKFQDVFKKFFGGGNAELKFIDSDDPLEAGLEVFAQLPGKKLIEMSSLSGGEKGLVSLSLIFAVFLTNPSPICVLDEVDAALDDSNVEKFCDLIEEISSNVKTRFLVITHHPLTMARMDRLYGVTMQEKGVSQLVSVDLNVAEKIRNIA
ncbi:chromosome segregation protein SMC, partial [OCS116 cluster bacterium]|nr:chromosome segregation protein SMC [OCS116 cluster bacterium]